MLGSSCSPCCGSGCTCTIPGCCNPIGEQYAQLTLASGSFTYNLQILIDGTPSSDRLVATLPISAISATYTILLRSGCGQTYNNGTGSPTGSVPIIATNALNAFVTGSAVRVTTQALFTGATYTRTGSYATVASNESFIVQWIHTATVPSLTPPLYACDFRNLTFTQLSSASWSSPNGFLNVKQPNWQAINETVNFPSNWFPSPALAIQFV